MRLPDIIQRELDSAPGRWKIEKGARHLHIRIDGKLAAILPMDGHGTDRSPVDALNLRAQIRRAIRGRAA